MIKWSASREDLETMNKIAARAVELAKKLGVPYKRIDALMDVNAAHANGCPLRLADLLAADDGNFGHDVFGIRRNLDRETGKLGGHFSPRYAVRKGA